MPNTRKLLLLTVCAIALAGCATNPLTGQPWGSPTQLPGAPPPTDTSKWPNPSTVSALLGGVEGAYATDCLLQPKVSWCSKSAQQMASNCKGLADSGLATYTQAYDTGDVTAAVLANEQGLLTSLIACIGKVKSKR